MPHHLISFLQMFASETTDPERRTQLRGTYSATGARRTGRKPKILSVIENLENSYVSSADPQRASAPQNQQQTTSAKETSAHKSRQEVFSGGDTIT